MSGNVGRSAKLKKGGSVLAGVRAKSITWGGESVDVTSSEDGGVRLLLSSSGQEQIDIPIEGITKDDTLLKISLDTASDRMLTDITLDFDIRNPINITPATLSGNFRLSGYEEGMPYNDAVTFSATLESSDGWVYTPEGSSTPTPTPGEANQFYSADYMMSPGWEGVTSSSGFYDSGSNRTYIAWQITSVPTHTTGFKSAVITFYDHTLGAWGEPRNIGNFFLEDDDHGHPSVVVDNDGYIHSVYGSHFSFSDFSQSTSILPNDTLGGWRFKKNIFGNATYPSLDNVGGVIYLMYRDDTTSTRRTLAVRSGTPAAGDLSFGAGTTLVDFGADSRFYPNSVQARGSDIHLLATRANSGDTERVGVYYFIYDTLTGAVENFDKSFSTPSGSLPVDLTTSNANYLIVDQGTDQGDVCALQFDSVGRANVTYFQGAAADTHYDLLHILLEGGTWSSPEVVASIEDLSSGAFVSLSTLAVAGDDMWAIYNKDSTSAWRRVLRSGVWLDEDEIVPFVSLPIARFSPVKYAHPDLNLFLSEKVVHGTGFDALAVKARRFRTSTENTPSSVIDLTGGDPDFYDVTALFGFDGVDGATEIYDESYGNHPTETAGGAVQLSSSHSKFGNTSLSFDGSTSYMSFGETGGANSEFSITGDFTIETWVRLNSISGTLQVIASRRPSSGNGQYQFLVSGVNTIRMSLWDAGGSSIGFNGTTTLTAGVWYHAAFTREGGTGRLFLNGILEATSSVPSVGVSDSLLYLGADLPSVTSTLDGYLSEFRITNGVARYTSSFTPHSAPHPRIKSID